jgi:YD repeat-containing protein
VQEGIYSTLSRLLSATNPENSMVTYTDDAAGNVKTRTDANGTQATVLWLPYAYQIREIRQSSRAAFHVPQLR